MAREVAVVAELWAVVASVEQDMRWRGHSDEVDSNRWRVVPVEVVVLLLLWRCVARLVRVVLVVRRKWVAHARVEVNERVIAVIDENGYGYAVSMKAVGDVTCEQR